MTTELRIAAAVALCVTVLLEPFVLRWLRRRSVVDIPNYRSSHSGPVPRGGGIAVVIGIAAGSLAASRATWAVVAPLEAFALLGLSDDLRPRPAALRLAAQLFLGATAGVAAAWVLDIPEPSMAAQILLGAVAIPAAVNAVNFMDGIDGMTGLNALVSGGLLAIAAQHAGAGEIAVVAVAIAAAGIGFLPWNMVAARVFLGDVGSYGIGAGLGICAVAIWFAGGGALAAVGPLALYFADTGFVILRRLARRESILEAHRDHVYQRLTDLGFSHVQVAFFTACASACIGGLSLLAGWTGSIRIAPLAGAMALLLTYMSSPALLRSAANRSGDR